MVRTQIQLEETQYRSLKELAARQNTSVAEVIRRAVDQLLTTTGTVSDDERRRRARAIVGRFRSGQSDVSERHDDYLTEIYGEWSSS